MKQETNQQAERNIKPKSAGPGMAVMTPVFDSHKIFKIRRYAANNQTGDRKIFFPNIPERKNNCRM
jgi:hypothetical protein